jgi:8-amino-7-oxononanoate synthase
VTGFELRLRSELAALDERNLRRTLRPPSGIDLSSNDYLCLAAHPRLRRALADAAEREGCGSTGSRLLRGEREGFARLERRFAAFKGAGRALYFSSGYLANLAVLSTFPQSGDAIFSDALNHASLIDAMRLARAHRHGSLGDLRVRIFGHCDVAALARMLREQPAAGQKFVVTESLFSMDGDRAPLAEYAALCRETGAILIVDEAHAVGIYGQRGSGLLEEGGAGAIAGQLRSPVLISINTAGKALGVSGAFVAGPEWAIEYLVQKARPFIFSTAAPVPLAAALEAALTLIEDEPWRRSLLRWRAGHLRELLGMPGDSPIVPVVMGANRQAVEVAAELQRGGFDVRAIRPPSVPEGTARLRVAVNVGITERTLERFAAMLAQTVKNRKCVACS